MEKRLKEYIKYAQNLSKTSWKSKEEQKQMQEAMLTQISLFQHERLIHLIVTVVFAILTFMTLISSLFVSNLYLYLLMALLIILLIPYIRHYYILENGVQKLYDLYDGLFCERIS
ncbi:MAG: hypothetical protein GX567_10740 [Clostridia bacterium]|nr:hypothetical protein [Clostridia bacterium]